MTSLGLPVTRCRGIAQVRNSGTETGGMAGMGLVGRACAPGALRGPADQVMAQGRARGNRFLGDACWQFWEGPS